MFKVIADQLLVTKKLTDFVFADNAILLVESLKILALALEVLREEAKFQNLQSSWGKAKVQSFGGLLDDTVQAVQACGEDIEVTNRFI